MKSMYQAIKNAAYNLFHEEPQAISFSRRNRRSLRWLALHARALKK